MGNLLACEAQAYRNDPSRCPQCASDKLTTGTADVDLLQTVVPVTCERCGASWDDRYEFAGICDDSLEVGSDIITREWLHRLGGRDSNEHGTPNGLLDVLLDGAYYIVPDPDTQDQDWPRWTLKRAATHGEGHFIATVVTRRRLVHLILGLEIDVYKDCLLEN